MKTKKRLITAVMAFSLCTGLLSGATAGREAAAATTSTTTIVPEQVNDFSVAPQGFTTTVVLPAGTGSENKDDLSVITPVQMDYTGMLYLNCAVAGIQETVKLSLYSDPACTLAVGSEAILNSYSLTDRCVYTINTPQTYYLKAYYSYSASSVATPITINAYAYSGEERTLTSDYQGIYSGNTTAKYHKMTVPADGMVTIYANAFSSYDGSASSMTINLCNSNKVVIADEYMYSYNGYMVSYALKKGTYYVQASESSPYQIKYTAKKVKDQSGSSKKKAKKLAKKKTVKGLVTLQDKSSKVDWISFTLKKAGRVTLNLKAECNSGDYLHIEIIPANKNYKVYNNTASFSAGERAVRTNKIRKGKYYIKISKTNAAYSGSYAIKYVK